MFKKKRKPGDPPPMGSLEHKIQVAQAYSQQWQDLFLFFSDSLTGKTITPEEEKEFGKQVYQIALGHFKYTRLMGRDFHNSKGIPSVLDKCASLAHLQAMPDAVFGAMQVEWHEVFIAMNKTLGSLIAQIPVGKPRPSKESKGRKKPAGKPKAKPKAKVAL